jgi:hypothetical protein
MADSEPSPHGWTLDTLEKYLNSRIDGLKEFYDAALAASKEQVTIAMTAADKAVTKAELANDKRFESVNEFRGALTDQSRDLLPRAEYLVQNANIVDRITLLTDTITKLQSVSQGRASGINAVGAIVLGCLAGLASLVAVISLFVAIRGQSVPQPVVSYVPAPTATPSAPAPITVPR